MESSVIKQFCCILQFIIKAKLRFSNAMFINYSRYIFILILIKLFLNHAGKIVRIARITDIQPLIS